VIRYALVCGTGHAFDGWFRNSADFDAEVAAGRLACPLCGSAEVGKALMAPAVAKGAVAETGAAADAPAPIALAAGPAEAKRQALFAALREIRRKVAAEADYVGPRFAEQARRIHYGEDEARHIWGEASRDEAVALLEEGIAVHPLPALPEDGH